MFSFRCLFTSLAAAAVGLLVSTSSEAGQYKTLNTENLFVNAILRVQSTPLNTGQAAEMEVYEWRSAATGGNYRCNIQANTTGQSLNLRWLGVNGTQIGTCTAPVGGNCSTATLGLVGNLKFICLVSTQNGAPVSVNARYLFSVTRHP